LKNRCFSRFAKGLQKWLTENGGRPARALLPPIWLMPKELRQKTPPRPPGRKTRLSYKRAVFEPPRKGLMARHFRGLDRHRPQQNAQNRIFMQKKRPKNLR
jgi:hypothetical protein